MRQGAMRNKLTLLYHEPGCANGHRVLQNEEKFNQRPLTNGMQEFRNRIENMCQRSPKYWKGTEASDNTQACERMPIAMICSGPHQSCGRACGQRLTCGVRQSDPQRHRKKCALCSTKPRQTDVFHHWESSLTLNSYMRKWSLEKHSSLRSSAAYCSLLHIAPRLPNQPPERNLQSETNCTRRASGYRMPLSPGAPSRRDSPADSGP